MSNSTILILALFIGASFAGSLSQANGPEDVQAFLQAHDE